MSEFPSRPARPPDRSEESKRTRWRHALFASGADAFARSFPDYIQATFPNGAPPVYVCPLCLRAFPIEAILAGTLTIEHAPPKCLGGPELLLTCSDCNNLAGRWLDVAMLKSDRPIAILRHEGPEEHYVRFGINGGPQVTAVIGSEGPHGTKIAITKREFNNPGDYDRFIAECDRVERTNSISTSTMQVRFHKDRHSVQRARVGWLRAAYLIAFAAFGYRYAFGSALDQVREQIRRYDDEVIPSFAVVIPDSARQTRRLAAQHDRNADLRCVVVQVGWHAIFLPQPSDADFYKRLLRARKEHPESCQWFGSHEYVWPTRPLYGGDGAMIAMEHS